MNAQQLIIGHLLPIAVAIMALWLVYRLLFSNSNRLQFNRFYLLTAMLFSLALPLVGLLMGTESQQMVSLKQNLFGGMMLNEVTITANGVAVLPEAEARLATATRPHLTLWQVLGGIYLIGVGVTTLLFLFKVGKLVALILSSPKEKREGFTAVFTGRDHGSFSFLRYAFFPDESVAPDIVSHELSHIRHGHSVDVLFAEAMMVLQWFNPFIYLYKKELQSLHEYMADRDVVATGVDKRNYMMLILQQCTAADFSGMSNNFSLILTKKRIKMITKNEKAKGLWWRLLATLPVLAILLVANTKVTAQEKRADDKKIDVEIGGQFSVFGDDGKPLQLTDTTIYADDGTYIKMESSDAFDPITGEPCKKLTVTSFSADGTPRNDFFITEANKNGDTTMYNIETFSVSESLFETLLDVATSKKDTVYQIAEEMPEFPGGLEALMDYVGRNVKYPEEAKDKEIQGRVFVSFVIEKDGSVNEVKVLRGIGGGCDEEAVRVIKAMPKWTPGKMKGQPVRVSYQIPINFKLDNPQKDNLKHLEGTLYKGIGTGKKGDVTNTMAMQMVFDTEDSGYFIMTLSSQKKNGKKNTEFEDVFLQFQYAFDGKSIGSIQPKNMDGGELGDEPMPPYGFLINKDGSITVNFYDFKEDVGIEQIVFKKDVK